MAEYIDRQAVIDNIEKSFDRETILNRFVRKIAISAVMRMEPAEVSPVVRGRWIMRGGKFRCSRCAEKALWSKEDGTNGFSREFTQEKSTFCPNCGADMRGTQDE